jgi:hypothetical protein
MDQEKLIHQINNENNPDLKYFLIIQYLKKYKILIEDHNKPFCCWYIMKNKEIYTTIYDNDHINLDFEDVTNFLRIDLKGFKNRIDLDILGKFRIYEE